MPRNNDRSRERPIDSEHHGGHESRDMDTSRARDGRSRDNGRSRANGRSLSPRRDENRGHQDEARRKHQGDRVADDTGRPDADPAPSSGPSEFYYRGSFVLILRRRLDSTLGPDAAPAYGDDVCIGTNGDNLRGLHDKLDDVVRMWLEQAGGAPIVAMLVGVPLFYERWAPNKGVRGPARPWGWDGWVIAHTIIESMEGEGAGRE
jgi:hypothetical protein